MTTDLRYDLPVAASADRLRAAIADVEGWWTTTVDRDGDEFTARFGVNWTRIRVAGERWTVTGQDTPAIPVPDEWVGDELTFAVEDAGDGTSVLHFAHHGLLAQACADDCRPAWQHFLRSLVALAETGVGTPRRPDAVAAG
jgi:hypothetical protein